MINVSQRVVVTNSVERIVRVKVQGGVVEVREPAKPRVQVVTVGVQGPVGTVAENVLARAAAAEQAAIEAASTAGQAAIDLGQLIADLNNAFAYHAGAISAQGG